jgi:hypothetical protein
LGPVVIASSFGVAKVYRSNGIVGFTSMVTPSNNGPITKRLPSLESELAGKRHVLEERRRAFDQVLKAGDVVETKLQALLSSASLIIALTGTVQLVVFQQAAGLFFWGLLLFGLALYIGMVIVIVRGLQPLNYLNPIPDTWQEIVDDYYYEDENRVLDTLIYNSLYFAAINQQRIGKKVSALLWATRLFMATVILIGVSIPLGFGVQNTAQPAALQSQPTVTLPPAATSTATVAAPPTATPVISPPTPVRTTQP